MGSSAFARPTPAWPNRKFINSFCLCLCRLSFCSVSLPSQSLCFPLSQARLTATEVLAGDNFSAIFTADRKIKRLEEQNATLLERVDDRENRSRRANLRILNVPEDSEKGQYTVKFISDLLMEAMGEEVFENPPELERAHRSPGQRPREGQPPRPFVVCFHRFQVKEKALRWAQTHDVEFNGSKLRIYPDMSAGLAKKRATFKNVKQLLYEKKIRFSLLHPARLRVQFEDETLFFHSPEDAKVFYDRRVAGPMTDSDSNGLI